MNLPSRQKCETLAEGGSSGATLSVTVAPSALRLEASSPSRPLITRSM